MAFHIYLWALFSCYSYKLSSCVWLACEQAIHFEWQGSDLKYLSRGQFLFRVHACESNTHSSNGNQQVTWKKLLGAWSRWVQHNAQQIVSCDIVSLKLIYLLKKKRHEHRHRTLLTLHLRGLLRLWYRERKEKSKPNTKLTFPRVKLKQ